MLRSLDDQNHWFEHFRPYLTLLARNQVNSHNPLKLDSSGIVQQTLLDAFAKREQFRGSCKAELAGWLRQILKHN